MHNAHRLRTTTRGSKSMTDRVTIRISQDLSEALDRFIEAGVAPVRSRQDAFRHIVTAWLDSAGYAPKVPIEPAGSQSPELGGR
jgi:hypothetical protein